MGEWIRHRGSKSMPKRLEGMRFEVKIRNGNIISMEEFCDSNFVNQENKWKIYGKHPKDVMSYRILEDDPALDGWIEWHGGEFPVAVGVQTRLKLRSGKEFDVNSPEDYRWTNASLSGDIIAYRLSKPDWPEDRVDVIGQNGNTGEHYEIDTSPEHIENEAENVHVDMVNEPPHYKQGDVECIDAIRAALTDEEWRGYCKGNALKYIWRERHKGGDESLQKAIWYLNRLVK